MSKGIYRGSCERCGREHVTARDIDAVTKAAVCECSYGAIVWLALDGDLTDAVFS